MLQRSTQLFAVASCAILSLLAPASAQNTGAPGGKSPPKLVLFMVVDGFPQDQLVKYYDLYGDRGFKLLLDKGGWYGNNHYSHATTYTSVGHATLLSCAHPYKHGVVGNDWIDKKTGKRLYSTEDARFKYLDEDTPDHSGTSPFNIKVTTVGDELIYANSKSKVIAIAGKDRSAIGLAGQYGTAYMHSATTGRFITSEYYMKDYPGWWKVFYELKPQNKYFKETWSLLLPEEAYARSTSDDRPWTTKYKELGTRFPHPIVGGAKEPGKAYYDAMMWTPFGDLLTFDFVKAAIEGENLGNNPAGVPDILAISWTSHDYVNHLFGPESRQSQDQTARLDRIFAELFDYLDQRIGLQNVLITLSADHGFMNVPEYSASRNLDAGRIDPDKMIEATNAALSAKFGDGKYITAWWNPTLYVDYKLLEVSQAQQGRSRECNAGFPARLSRRGGCVHPHANGTGHDAEHQTSEAGDPGLASEDQRRHRHHEQAELVSVRKAQHLRLDPWLTMVV